jgi:16S rRNA G966 N2-methylase RsmD
LSLHPWSGCQLPVFVNQCMIALSDTLKAFITEHAADDIHRLLLSAHRYPGIDIPFVVQQIEGRRKAGEKFPSLLLHNDFIYPVKLSMEQCSSEQTAVYKASIVKGLTVADLTGGLGIDALFMAKTAENVCYVEQNAELHEIATHNFAACGVKIESHCEDGISFLKTSNRHFDCLYLDPARRDRQRNKLVRLDACEPNVLQYKELLFEHADRFLLKASPMLDITQAAKELGCVSHVHVVAVRNECKELLFDCRKQVDTLSISCVNIDPDSDTRFDFSVNEETAATIQYASIPATYLYEPNVALLKAGAFRLVAQRFNLLKLHPDTHLYTSDALCVDFPGRVFEIKEVFSLNKKELSRVLPSMKANVSTRNFPIKPEEIQRKFGLVDGGDDYLFAVTFSRGDKCALLCHKVKRVFDL